MAGTVLHRARLRPLLWLLLATAMSQLAFSDALTITGASGSCSCNSTSTVLFCRGLGIAYTDLPARLDACPALQSIDLRLNSLTSVPRTLFQGLNNLCFAIDLGFNFITSLPSGVFAGLSQVNLLALQYNQLTDLPVDIFEDMTQLTVLYLMQNRLSYLPAGVFKNQAQLTELMISGNNLSSVSEEAFIGLRALMTLDLSQNMLLRLPERVFTALTVLQSLNLRQNSLTTLPGGLFATLTQATSIILWSNRLTSLSPDIFASVSQLNELDLSQNQLTTLPSRVFSHLTGLLNLHLGNNLISQLPEDAFDGLHVLSFLTLSNNMLRELPANVFFMLPVLTNLLLDNNLFSTLPELLFSEITGLWYLNLNGNKLTSLSRNLFQNLTQLTELLLSQNQITSIAEGAFDSLSSLNVLVLSQNSLTSVHPRQFANLSQMQTLMLDQNRLTQLPNDFFFGLTRLLQIFLDGNSLVSIASEAFNGLPALNLLSMQFNNLTRLPPGIFAELPQLATLQLGNNQLTEVAATDFAALASLQTLSLAENNISLVDPAIFGQTRNTSNLALDMLGNPSVCQTGWQPRLQTTVVYCFCAYGTVGVALPGQQAASGCRSPAMLEIVELPTVLVSGVPALVQTALANETAAGLCQGPGACCTANVSSNSTLQLFTQTYSQTCQLAAKLMAVVVLPQNTVFNSLAVFALFNAGLWVEPVAVPAAAQLSFTLAESGQQVGVPAPFVVNPQYPASVSFALNSSGLPAGLRFDSETGVISGTPQAGLAPSNVTINQVTQFGRTPVAVPVTQVTLSVRTCDDSFTCRGGQCVFEVSAFGGPFGCRCPAGQIGQFCEFGNPFSAGSASAASGYGFLSLVVALAVSLLVSLAHRAWRTHLSSRALSKTNVDLLERLLQTEEEMGTLQRVWQIQASELQIEREVARGAFGVVLKAVWNELPVAVKKLDREASHMDAAEAEEFEREVSFMRTVRHPHVVLFHGAGVFESGLPFLVTEYMARGSLRKVLADSPDIAWAQKLQFALDTAKGMQHLHSLGTIHRDLKSGNLLVTQGFRIKVADFGTARLARMTQATGGAAVGAAARAVGDGSMTTMVGSPLWMAPEIVFKQAYTQKADVYSYGIVLYEILTQQLPWSELPSKFLVNRLEEALRAGRRPALGHEDAGGNISGGDEGSQGNVGDGGGGERGNEAVSRAERASYQQLMERCWAQKAEDRPSFDEVVVSHAFINGSSS